MLKEQKALLNYIREVEVERKKIEILTDIYDFGVLEKAIEGAELLVPILGAFSAGKSSLLNSFLGQRYLPVGITPETALATEIRYSTEEYIEAVKADNTFDKYKIDEIEAVKNRAADYKFLRMYINVDSVRKIEPLILVDMPGFDSPSDLHNQAILEYINKGVHYIVLTSVEDGTITRSMIRQLSDIREFGRDFSFFVSKTNLRAQSEVEDILNIVKEQIEDIFDITKEVVPIDDDGGASLSKIISEIDPEKLFSDLFISELRAFHYTIVETINTAITALGKNKIENEQTVLELKYALDAMLKERDLLIEKVKENHSETKINRVIETVGKELSTRVDELIRTALNGGQSALANSISDIVRHSLIGSIKATMSEIGNEVVDSFSCELSNINSSITDFSVSDDWSASVAGQVKTMLGAATNGMANIVNNRGQKEGVDKTYKAITTVLAVTSTVIAPILELVIVFLPEILSGIFASVQKQKREDQVREAILTQTIPTIKRELRLKLPEVFNRQVREMINNISGNFESAIQEKQEIISFSQREIESEVSVIEKKITEYKMANDTITSLANKILFAKEV